MYTYRAPLRDIRFVVHDVLDFEGIGSVSPAFLDALRASLIAGRERLF